MKDIDQDLEQELVEMKIMHKLVTILVNVGVLLMILFSAYYIVVNRTEHTPPTIADHPPTTAAPASDSFDSVADSMKE